MPSTKAGGAAGAPLVSTDAAAHVGAHTPGRSGVALHCATRIAECGRHGLRNPVHARLRAARPLREPWRSAKRRLAGLSWHHGCRIAGLACSHCAAKLLTPPRATARHACDAQPRAVVGCPAARLPRHDYPSPTAGLQTGRHGTRRGRLLNGRTGSLRSWQSSPRSQLPLVFTASESRPLDLASFPQVSNARESQPSTFLRHAARYTLSVDAPPPSRVTWRFIQMCA
jgi:hypothetical protein